MGKGPELQFCTVMEISITLMNIMGPSNATLGPWVNVFIFD